MLEGVFALGASDDEAAAQAALERRVLGELLNEEIGRASCRERV